MSNEEILREYRDDSKFPYLSQVINQALKQIAKNK